MSAATVSWRDPILGNFTSEIARVARLTIVHDPDHLLTEQRLTEALRERGFEVISFEDHVATRYTYERRFRQHWDAGRSTDLAVVLRTPGTDVTSLPYDLLDLARRDSRLLSFSLAELFPRFAPDIVAELERKDLDPLFWAQQAHQPESLGENATRDFLLRHVFQIAPELIKNDADLLHLLLRLHHASRVLPTTFIDRLVWLLRETGQWREWPLEQLFAGRGPFFEFLQERWPLFLRNATTSAEGKVSEPRAVLGLQHGGAALLPFDDDDVRVYIDDLFVEGLLTPTTAISKESVRGTWMAIGVRGDEASDDAERLRKLLELIEAELPAPLADHQLWLQLAQRWAEIVALRWVVSSDLGNPGLDALQGRLERGFQEWLSARYASLASLSHWPRPVMLHHIPHFLAHASSGSRIRPKRALLVVDGLALDQWAVIRQTLPVRDWSMQEDALFAWVPTLTSVSRQAIFAGEPPFLFAPSIETTQKEEQHWLRFWESCDLRRSQIAYFCQREPEAVADLTERLRARVEDPTCAIVGIVVGTVDRIVHGTVTGTAGVQASVRDWAQRGELRNLIELLLTAGFEVFITADHGNVQGQGLGKPNVGVTVNQRGERVHVFRDDDMRRQVADRYPGSIAWPPIGLPENYLPLIAPAGRAFIAAGEQAVSHGGIALEEIIVPFIRVTKNP